MTFCYAFKGYAGYTYSTEWSSDRKNAIFEPLLKTIVTNIKLSTALQKNYVANKILVIFVTSPFLFSLPDSLTVSLYLSLSISTSFSFSFCTSYYLSLYILLFESTLKIRDN